MAAVSRLRLFTRKLGKIPRARGRRSIGGQGGSIGGQAGSIGDQGRHGESEMNSQINLAQAMASPTRDRYGIDVQKCAEGRHLLGKSRNISSILDVERWEAV